MDKRKLSIAKLKSPLSSSPLSRGSPSPFYDDDDDDVGSRQSSGSGDFGAGLDDPRAAKTAAKYVSAEGLRIEGGDIAHDLTKLKQPSGLRRSHSSSSVIDSGRGSRAGSFNVPGGFRRQFLQQQRHTETPGFLTRNFVEFLQVYGHFAGEELEDDDDIACHYRTDDEESRLLGPPRRGGTASDTKAFFLLVKAFVGTGVLFLPKAFSNGGLVFSSGVLAVFGALSFWCYLVLVYAKEKTRVSSFAEIGAKLYGPWFQRLILLSIVISQLGFVAAYIVFTSENLRAFIYNSTGIEVAKSVLILAQMVVLTPLSLIRDITKLSLSAVIANFLVLGGLVTIVYYIARQWLVTQHGEFGPEIEFFFNKSKFSLFVGVAIFAFEGIGLIIPIQESMRYPEHFPKVLGGVIATISAIFIFMGALGYLTYGKHIHTVILLNLPQDSPAVISIQLLYSVAILLSTPLQLFPAIRLVESKALPKSGKASARVKWEKNVFRTCSVALVSLIAYFGGRNLDKFVSFIGCFACIPLVYMYPPILHYKSCCCDEPGLDARERRRRYWLGVVDYVLVAVGAVALVYTTLDIMS
ncbi:vacuolar amino acid transporter 4 [Diutina catenulata]